MDFLPLTTYDPNLFDIDEDVYDYDFFARADTGTAGPGVTEGAGLPWIVSQSGSGTPKAEVIGQRLRCTATSGTPRVFSKVNSGKADGRMEGEIYFASANAATGIRIPFRMVDETNYLALYVNSGGFYAVGRWINDSGSQLLATTRTPVSGDRFQIDMLDTAIALNINRVRVDALTSSDFKTATWKAYAYSTSNPGGGASTYFDRYRFTDPSDLLIAP